ncbi:MAG: hypothetical protein ABIV63_02515, partial [Caldimonas sp.]
MHDDDRPMQPVDATQTTSDIDAGGVASGFGSDVESDLSATDPSATDPSATDPSATDPSAIDPSSTDPMAPGRTETEADPTAETRAEGSQPRPQEMSPAACAARLA